MSVWGWRTWPCSASDMAGESALGAAPPPAPPPAGEPRHVSPPAPSPPRALCPSPPTHRPYASIPTYTRSMMDMNKKLNDCYFYYYSTCTKGDNCQFRHEPLALGVETMCYHWQQGNCADQQCKFRHMELRKNRKQIPCYWETQPGGCLKTHCPFQHKTAPGGSGDNSIHPQQMAPQIVGPLMSSVNQDQGNMIAMHNITAMGHPPFPRPSRRPMMDPTKMLNHPAAVLGAPHNRRPGHDPLLVNLEEESDSESVPSSTPIKKRLNDYGSIKSLEEIRLERIHAECAAFYSYSDNDDDMCEEDDYPIGHKRTFPRRYVDADLDRVHIDYSPTPKNDDFKILSLKEIRAAKRKNVASEKKFDTEHDVSDKSLEECLRIINGEPADKKMKPNNGTTQFKPKLIRNRYNTDTSIKLNDNCDINDKRSNESNVRLKNRLLTESYPDVVISCVKNDELSDIVNNDETDELKQIDEFLDE